MANAPLLYPVFVQVALTFALMLWTAYARVSALRRREVRMGDIALGQNAWPERPTQIARSFQNQFELPMLFYALVALALITGKADGVLTWMAWAFVALRIWHAAIHVTHNTVTARFYVFVAGALMLIAMWARFALQLLSQG